MPDKRIKHFIFVRFFTFEDPKYPHDIYDVIFLTKQLLLAKHNALPSLENQTNKNFELVFMVNPKFFGNPKYDFVFSALQCATTLPVKFIKPNEQARLIKDAYETNDFVISSRMDFDDFIFKDGVADTQNKVKECDSILSYGYCKGYKCFDRELYNCLLLYKKVGHHSILGSMILKSTFAKKLPFIGVYSFNHTKVKIGIKGFLEKNGLEFSENMFQQNISTSAFIYFRGDFSHCELANLPGEFERLKKAKPTNDKLTKKQLAEEFGFHLKLNSIK